MRLIPFHKPAQRQTHHKWTLLAVCPADDSQSVSTMMREERRCEVRTAHGLRAVCALEAEYQPEIALLFSSMGAQILRYTAEYIRHRWAHARIAVVGHITPALEDNLYDEDIDASSGTDEIRKLIDRCTQLPAS